jgi:hypothetical protein
MMVDADVVACSPCSVYRVLRDARVLHPRGKESKKGKGLATTHSPPALARGYCPRLESCVGGCEAFGEALTGAHSGQPLSCEVRLSGRRLRLAKSCST